MMTVLLEYLNIYYCSKRVVLLLLITTGAEYIGEVLINSLLAFWIGENMIEDDGIITITAAPSKSKVKNLNIEICDITITGANHWSKEFSLSFIS